MFNRLITIVFLILSVNLYGQQNFFNVPSSDITTKYKSFFQQQINLFDKGFQSNSTYNFGLGNGFEMGVNYSGLVLTYGKEKIVSINDTSSAFNPFFLANAQKRFELSERLAVSFGTQAGFTTTKRTKSGVYSYSNCIYNHKKNGFKTVLGTYYASDSYFGKGDRFFFSSPLGIQAGIEKSIWKDILVFQADMISGQHAVGELVIGGVLKLNHHWLLSSGYQIPTFASSSFRSIVFELTFVQ